MSSAQRAVLIRWEDSVILDAGWLDKSDAIEQAGNCLEQHASIGFLVHEDARCLVLAGGSNRDGSRLQGTVRIPRRSVVQLEELRLPEPRR